MDLVIRLLLKFKLMLALAPCYLLPSQDRAVSGDKWLSGRRLCSILCEGPLNVTDQ
jgi:hypothetical protein